MYMLTHRRQRKNFTSRKYVKYWLKYLKNGKNLRNSKKYLERKITNIILLINIGALIDQKNDYAVIVSDNGIVQRGWSTVILWIYHFYRYSRRFDFFYIIKRFLDTVLDLETITKILTHVNKKELKSLSLRP